MATISTELRTWFVEKSALQVFFTNTAKDASAIYIQIYCFKFLKWKTPQKPPIG